MEREVALPSDPLLQPVRHGADAGAEAKAPTMCNEVVEAQHCDRKLLDEATKLRAAAKQLQAQRDEGDVRAFWGIDGVLDEASLSAAYKRFARKYHPDQLGLALARSTLPETSKAQITDTFQEVVQPMYNTCREFVRTRQKCSVCGWNVPASGNYRSGSVGLAVAGKLVSSTCTCGPPTFTEGLPPKRPAHWPSLDDPYAYYNGRTVPMHADLQRPGKQQFTQGDMKGKTFKDVYDMLDFYDFSLDRDAVADRRLAFEKAYAGTEDLKRFKHYVGARSCLDMHPDSP